MGQGGVVSEEYCPFCNDVHDYPAKMEKSPCKTEGCNRIVTPCNLCPLNHLCDWAEETGCLMFRK